MFVYLFCEINKWKIEKWSNSGVSSQYSKVEEEKVWKFRFIPNFSTLASKPSFEMAIHCSDNRVPFVLYNYIFISNKLNTHYLFIFILFLVFRFIYLISFHLLLLIYFRVLDQQGHNWGYISHSVWLKKPVPFRPIKSKLLINLQLCPILFRTITICHHHFIS